MEDKPLGNTYRPNANGRWVLTDASGKEVDSGPMQPADITNVTTWPIAKGTSISPPRPVVVDSVMPRLTVSGSVVAVLTPEEREALANLVVEKLQRWDAKSAEPAVYAALQEWGGSESAERQKVARTMIRLLRLCEEVEMPSPEIDGVPLFTRATDRASVQQALRQYLTNIGDSIVAAYDRIHAADAEAKP